MSKNFELKQQAVEQISEKIKNCKSLVIVEYKGLTVDEATQLRAKCRAASVDYCVLKNPLVRRALAGLNIVGLDDTLEGPSAFVFSNEDPVSGAKILKEFMEADKKEAIKVKAGLLDGEVLDVAGVKKLADLPSREALLSMLCQVLTGTVRSLACVLEAVRKQKAGEE